MDKAKKTGHGGQDGAGEEPSGSRVFAPAEAAQKLISQTLGLARYWASEDRDNRDWKAKVEGMAHSIGALLEGRTMGLPGMRICASLGEPLDADFSGPANADWPDDPLGMEPSAGPGFGIALRMCAAACDSRAGGGDDLDCCLAAARSFLSTFSTGKVAIGTHPHEDDEEYCKSEGENWWPMAKSPAWERADPEDASYEALSAVNLSRQAEGIWGAAESLALSAAEKRKLEGHVAQGRPPKGPKAF